MATQSNVMTSAQLAAMTPAQQQQYLSSLNSADAASAQAQLSQFKQTANAAYLAQSVEKIATCFPASGGITANYATGQTLVFNFPTASGAFATDLLITLNLSLAFAAGTAAAYALTAGSWYNLFNEIDILFNGTQARIRPYMLKLLEFTRKFEGMPASNQLIGPVQNVAGVTSALQSQPYAGGTAIATGNQTVNLVWRLPLNALHKLSPIGMLPIQGSGTKAQVVLQCANSLYGSDPLLNVAYGTAGTAGWGITVNAGSTVKVEAIYRDGTNLSSPTPLSLDLVGIPTAQYIIDTPLTPLAASVVQRQRVATLLQHYYMFGVIIDGNQSAQFALDSNIAGLELDQDSVGQNKFWQYGTANNVSVNDMWEMFRNIYGQDFDQGVVPWIHAQAGGQEDPDNRMGNRALNMLAGGWTDVHHGYILNTVGGQAAAFGMSVITPRIELYLISLNPAGLVQA